MATPTKIVVHFDDGSTIDVAVAGMSSVFLNEAAAIRGGNRPPYQPGPPPGIEVGGGSTSTSTSTMSTMGGTCYYINGIIICP